MTSELDTTISPQAARRATPMRLTEHFTARKQAKAVKVAANPWLGILYGVARKVFGALCVAAAVAVWMQHARTSAKLLVLDPRAQPGHFEQYVAIGLLALAVLAMFPDLFAAVFDYMKGYLPRKQPAAALAEESVP